MVHLLGITATPIMEVMDIQTHTMLAITSGNGVGDMGLPTTLIMEISSTGAGAGTKGILATAVDGITDPEATLVIDREEAQLIRKMAHPIQVMVLDNTTTIRYLLFRQDCLRAAKAQMKQALTEQIFNIILVKRTVY